MYPSSGQIVTQDTFAGRTVAAGSWGTSSDGNTWSVLQGFASDLSVSSGEGVITGNDWDQMVLGSTKLLDAEILVRYASNMDNGGGPVLRVVNSTNFIHFRCGTAQAGLSGQGIWFRVQVGGTNFDYGAVAFTFTSGAFYWFRARVQDLNMFFKVWADGTPEPAAWTTTATMSGTGTINQAGQVGIMANDSNARVDHFTAAYTPSFRPFVDATSMLRFAEWSGTLAGTTNSYTATDTLTVTESLSFAGASSYTDALSLSESIAGAGASSYTDPALTVTESQTSAGGAAYTDVLTVTDAQAGAGSASYSDALTVTETQTDAGGASYTDPALTVAESVSNTGEPTLTDSLAATETATGAAATSYTDQLNVTESGTVGVPLGITDIALSVLDSLSFTGAPSGTDSLAPSESTSGAAASSYTEVAGVSDGSSGSGATSFADSLTTSESITLTPGGSGGITLSIEDTALLAHEWDAQFARATAITESLTLMDASTLQGEPVLTDNLVPGASFLAFAAANTLADTTPPDDQLLFAASESFAAITLNPTDSQAGQRAATYPDVALTPADSTPTMLIGSAGTDLLTSLERLTVNASAAFADNALSPADSAAFAGFGALAFTDFMWIQPEGAGISGTLAFTESSLVPSDIANGVGQQSLSDAATTTESGLTLAATTYGDTLDAPGDALDMKGKDLIPDVALTADDILLTSPGPTYSDVALIVLETVTGISATSYADTQSVTENSAPLLQFTVTDPLALIEATTFAASKQGVEPLYPTDNLLIAGATNPPDVALSVADAALLLMQLALAFTESLNESETVSFSYLVTPLMVTVTAFARSGQIVPRARDASVHPLSRDGKLTPTER